MQIPYSEEAEQSILGACLLSADALAEAAEKLKPTDFYLQKHKMLFDAILYLYDQNRAIDIVSVLEHLRVKKLLQQAGGAAYITSLAEAVPTPNHIRQYIDIVTDKAIRRRIIEAAQNMMQLVNAEADLTKLVAAVEQDVLKATATKETSGVVRLGDMLPETLEMLEQRTIPGVATGYKPLDDALGGLHNGDFIVLAARPGMGKTALAQCIATNVAKRGIPVLYFSLEMSIHQLAIRGLSAEGNVDGYLMRARRLREHDWDKLGYALEKLVGLPIWIDDKPERTTMEMRSIVRRMKRQEGIGLVIVDHMQIIADTYRGRSRNDEMAAISRSLKAMAKESNLPVLALSQLSRKKTDMKDKRPELSDLRDSGAIEQDADVVLFIHRDYYYTHNPEDKGIAEIIVAKQRNGPIGSFKLAWQEDYTRFTELARRDESA